MSFGNDWPFIDIRCTSAQSDQRSDDAQDLDSVRVTGVRANIQKSLVEKHSASGIVDAISTENTGIRARDEVRAALIPLSPTYYVFNEDRDTTGTTLTLQFHPSDALTFSVDGLYSKLKNKRLQLRPDFPIDGSIDASLNPVIKDGVIDFIPPATDFPSNPEDLLFNVFIMNPTSNKDEETQFRFDVDWRFMFGVRVAL